MVDSSVSPLYDQLQTAQLSRRFGWFSFVLFLVYAVLLLLAAIPVRVLQPSWQISLSNALLENAPIPLLGLGMLYLASYFDPDDDKLQARVFWIAKVCTIVSLAFLLLIPLRAYSVWSLVQQRSNVQDRQISQVNSRLKSVENALRQARDKQQLIQLLQQSKAPALPPELAAQSFEQIRQELSRSLQNMQTAINARQAPQNRTALNFQLIRDSLRAMVLAFLYFVGFAAAGQLRSSQLPFIDDLIALFTLRRDIKGPKSTDRAMETYIDKLIPEDEKDPIP